MLLKSSSKILWSASASEAVSQCLNGLLEHGPRTGSQSSAECRMNSGMKSWLPAFVCAIAISIVGHLTQWFGFTTPSIDTVRAEANAANAATNVRVDENEKRTAGSS
jgi:hypothetical protein